MSTATILDKLERLERAATPGPFQTGGATPHHSDTLVLWDAVFDAQGSIIAYVVNEPTTHLFAQRRPRAAARGASVGGPSCRAGRPDCRPRS